LILDEKAAAVTTSDKKEINIACASFCALDMRAFNTITGEGFLQMAQAFIDLGASRGKVSINSVIPDRTTVSRQVASLAATKRLQLSAYLEECNSIG
jgi:hypothetical protein